MTSKNIKIATLLTLSLWIAGHFLLERSNADTSPLPSPEPSKSIVASPGPLISGSPSPSPSVSPSHSPTPFPSYWPKQINGYSSLGVQPPADQILYVSSSSGSDTNPGTLALPVKTLKHANDMEHTGKYSWILLKRNDRWVGNFYLHKGGVDATHRAVLSAYGQGHRPVINGPGTGFSSSHVTIQSIHYVAPVKIDGGGNDAIVTGAGNTDVILENNLIEGYFVGIDIDCLHKDDVFTTQVQIRRNIIVDSWSQDSHGNGFSQGIYVCGTKGLLVEENTFDHVGYNYPPAPIPSGQASGGGTSGNIFDHANYLTTNNQDVTVRGNLYLNGLDSMQVRPGGFVEDNFSAWNGINIMLGYARGAVRRNVILWPNDLTPTTPRGFGISIGKPLEPFDTVQVSNNLVAHEASPKLSGSGISFSTGQNVTAVNNLVYDIPTAYQLYPSAPIQHFLFQNNQVYNHLPQAPGPVFQNWFPGVQFVTNSYFTQVTKNPTYNGNKIYPVSQFITQTGQTDAVTTDATFVDPNRTIETYMASLGYPATKQAFITKVRSMGLGFYDERFSAYSLNAYFKAGFVKKP